MKRLDTVRTSRGAVNSHQRHAIIPMVDSSPSPGSLSKQGNARASSAGAVWNVRKIAKRSRSGYAKVLAACAVTGIAGGIAHLRADVVISYAEDPNAQTSSLTGTTVDNFTSLNTGTTYTNLSWSGVGTYDKIHTLAANQYGGAGGTGVYVVQSASTGLGNVPTTVLTLNTPTAYFGLWWSAGDTTNEMKFYNGSTLVADFTTTNLVNKLPSTYLGNPNNRSQDSSEKFAFLNFFGSGGTTWNKIEFINNNAGSGFESDNHTISSVVWDPTTMGRYPGVVYQVTNASGSVRVGAANAVTTPVNLGNIHTSGTFGTSTLSLQNTIATGTDAATLNVAMQVGSGAATASGSITGLAAQATDNTHLIVGLTSPSTSGPKTGTVILTPSSDGITLAIQTVTINGTAYDYAAASVSNPISLGNVHVNGAFAAQAATVQNTAANSGYSEKLDATLSASAGNVVTNGGTITQLAPQATNNTSMTVRLNDTATAGHKSGQATVTLTSDGTGTSGLGNTSLGTRTINISGDVYRYAAGTVTPTPINLGNVRIGTSFGTQNLTVTNTAADDGYSEKLDASFGALSGTSTTNGGSISLLIPQGANSANMQVGLSTPGTAGAKTGTAVVNLTSDGAGTSGLGNTALTPQTITINGGAYDYANPTYSNAVIAFGNVHPSATPISRTVAVGNSTITSASYQDSLNATLTPSNSKLSGNSFSGLAASTGGVTTNNLTVTANISTPGSLADSNVALGLVSNANGVTGLSNATLTGGTLTTTGGVYAYAAGAVSSPVSLGNIHVGGTFAPKPVTVQNTVADNGGFSEKLDATLSASAGNVVTNSGTITRLAPQASDNTHMTVSLNDTATAGHKTGQTTVTLTSDGTGTSGLTNTSLGSKSVNISGDVYRYAAGTVTPTPINLGNVRVGTSFGTQNLTVTNTAVDDGYSEKLDASFGTLGGTATTNSGSVSLLDPQAANSASMQVGLSTPGTAGAKTGTAVVNLTSDGTGTSGLGNTALTPQTITINGSAYDYANPTALPTLAMGNVRPGTTVSKTVAVGNAAITDVNHQDSLDASVSPSNSKLSGTGFAALAASTGGITTANLTIDANTSSAGSLGDTVTVNYTSNANGVAGLSNKILTAGQLMTTGGVYDYAQLRNAPIDVNVNYGNYHLSSANTAVTNSVAFVNKGVVNPAYTDNLVVNSSNATGNLSGGTQQTLAATASDASGSFNYSLDISQAGVRSGSLQVNYLSSPTVSLDTKQLATQHINASAKVYTGQSTWNSTAGGFWGGDPQNDATHANWGSNDGAPGVWGPSFDNVDTATFGGMTGSDPATITVDSAVSVKGITFANSGGSYTIVAQGTGSLGLKSDSGTASLGDSAGSHTITAPITMQSNVSSNVADGARLTVNQLLAGTTGAQALTKTGAGTLVLNGSSTYAGKTTIEAGKLQVDGSIASSDVEIKSGATLTGTNGFTRDVTVDREGTISPGDTGTSSKITAAAQIWNAGGKYAVDVLSMPAGGNNDLLSMSGIQAYAGFRVNVNFPTLTMDDLGTGAPGTNMWEWLIAQSSGSGSTFGSGNLVLSMLNLQPDVNTYQYKFGLVEHGTGTSGTHGLYLQYNYNAVPEAGTAMLGAIALMPILAHRRRRKVTETPAVA